MPANLVRSSRQHHSFLKPFKAQLTATYALSLAASFTTIAKSADAPPSASGGEQAQSADAFVDSIGVAVHLNYTGGRYGRFNDIIKPRLKELGVCHIRDGGQGAEFAQKLNDLTSVGIKSTLVMDTRNGTTPTNVVGWAKQIAASLEAAEGPNEWDINPGVTYKGKAFPHGLGEYQNDLYTALKAKTYWPLNSTSTTNSYSKPKSIDLSVPDHPLVVELN